MVFSRRALALVVAVAVSVTSVCFGQGAPAKTAPSNAPSSAQRPAAQKATAPARATPAKPTYNQLISSGYDALRAGSLKKAYVAAMEASATNPNRFESYALAALILHEEGSDGEAKPFIEQALARVPPGKKAKVAELAKLIGGGALPAAASAPLDPEAQRKLDVLRLIVEDADKATGAETRNKFLKEFLDKSEPFVTEYPNEIGIWALRATAAVELNAAREGRQAAFELMKSGLDKSKDEKIRRLVAVMDRKGWIYEMNLEVPPLVTEFNRTLMAMGTIKGGRSDKKSQGSADIERTVVYSALQGNCTSGFDLETNQTSSFTAFGLGGSTRTLSGIYHFDVTSVKFYSGAEPNQFLHLDMIGGYSSIRNKKGHEVRTFPENFQRDYEPEDTEFILAARSTGDAEKLAELLNKLHWACLSQQK